MNEFFSSPYLMLYARLALGGVLVVGAVGKLLDTRNAPDAVAAQVPFLPPALARPAAVALPWIELLVGGLLLAGLGLVVVGPVALAMMVLFTVLITRDVVAGRRTACSCFGRFSSEDVSELTIVRDLFLVLLAGLITLSASRYLALDGLWQSQAAGGPPLAEAILVALLAAGTVIVVILGASLLATVRGLLRAY